MQTRELHDTLGRFAGDVLLPATLFGLDRVLGYVIAPSAHPALLVAGWVRSALWLFASICVFRFPDAWHSLLRWRMPRAERRSLLGVAMVSTALGGLLAPYAMRPDWVRAMLGFALGVVVYGALWFYRQREAGRKYVGWGRHRGPRDSR